MRQIIILLLHWHTKKPNSHQRNELFLSNNLYSTYPFVCCMSVSPSVSLTHTNSHTNTHTQTHIHTYRHTDRQNIIWVLQIVLNYHWCFFILSCCMVMILLHCLCCKIIFSWLLPSCIDLENTSIFFNWAVCSQREAWTFLHLLIKYFWLAEIFKNLRFSFI